MKDRIRAHLAAHHDRYEAEIVDLLTRFVAIRTVNAGRQRVGECEGQDFPGEETRMVEALGPWFATLGVPVEVHAHDPQRANLIATLGQGGRALAVGAHTDIVPAGKGWHTDPFVATLKDGKLYGRGVLDNKGPLVACMAAMRLLVECEVPLAGRFQLAAIASEEFRESGEVDPGIEFLVEQVGWRPDFAIIPDIGENMRSIDIAEKGRTEVVITAIGKQAHGSTPERGANAVYQMARLIERIEGHTLAHEVHPVLGGPTINLGLITGGAAANIVPGECAITLDVRFVPGMTPDGIRAEFEALAEQVGGQWRFEVGASSLPHAIDADNELVRAIRRNTAPVLGFDPQPFGMGGGTFAKTFNLAGIPAVGWGPGDDEAFHVADEFIEVAQLVSFAELLALVAVDLLGTR